MIIIIGDKNKCQYRFLTPRECFLLMGFDEKDFDSIISEPIFSKDNKKFYTRDKLYKLAGNSIVVNVLEEIFKQVDYINTNIIPSDNAQSRMNIISKKIKELNRYNLGLEENYNYNTQYN